MLGVGGLPQLHFTWLGDRGNPDGAIVLEFPEELRTRLFAQKHVVIGDHALPGIGVPQRVIRVGYIAQVLLAFQIVVVETRRVRQKVLVASRVHDVLGHDQPVAVFVGLLNSHQRLELGRAAPLHDPEVFIILHRGRVETIGAIVVLEGLFVVEQVDYHGRDRHHTLVHGGRGPGGPTAFGAARDHKVLDLHFPAGAALQEIDHCVHGAHRALCHRQAGRPHLVAGAQKLVPGVRDELVLHQVSLGRVWKVERLVGNHSQLRHHAVRREGEIRHPRVNLFGRLVFIRSARDEQEAGRVGDLIRPHHGQPVLPHAAIGLDGRLPGLRRQFEHEGGVTFSGNRVNQLEFVAWVRRADVAIERGFL